MKKNLLFSIILSLFIYKLSYSQAPYWKLNGNSTIGSDLVNNTNNFLGTTANATTLRIGVNGSQDIFVDNSPAQLFPPNPLFPGTPLGGHWVGLGRIFAPSVGVGAFPLLAPKAHLHIHGGNQSGAGFGFSAGMSVASAGCSL